MVKLLLENLNCPNCAKKIEDAVRKHPDVKSVEFNFINKLMTIDTDKDEQITLKIVKNIVDSIEDGVNTIPYNGNREEKQDNSFIKKSIVRLILGGILFLMALFIDNDYSIVFYVASYLVFGYDVLIRAIKNITKGQMLDENFLMSIATIAAFAISQYHEAVAVMLFYQIGEFLQDLAVDKSKKSIKSLMSLNSDSVNVFQDGNIIVKDTKNINIGDVIVVKAGEKVAVDGLIVKGETSFDMRALTGESVPVTKVVGDKILSGSVNNGGTVYMVAEKLFEDSTVSKILDMVENAVGKKSKIENFVSKFSKVYTPIVVAAAILLIVIPILLGADVNTWVYRGLVFLVSSCPCALVVSIPLTFFSGIGSMSTKGVLVKGSNYLQQLASLDAIAMDKTGTVTMGKFEVADVIGDETLMYAASLERFSNHPIADAIVKQYKGEYLDVNNQLEEAGFGITASLDDKIILVGNKKLMDKHNIQVDNNYNVFVAVDDKLIGSIDVKDKIKSDSISAINDIKRLGIKNVTMLTGDKKEIAEVIGKQANIDNVYSELLPLDKVNKFEEMCGKYDIVAAVGDGINDAPLLARADVGIAMGGIGSDAAIEAADVVIMDDMLSKIPLAIQLSRYTIKVCKENVTFIIAVKVIVMVLAAFGFANMWLAVFADVGTALIAILNSIKIVKR